jgi:hypothetical protein
MKILVIAVVIFAVLCPFIFNHVAFGINYDAAGRNTTTSGIYVTTLAFPIPEFFLPVPMLLASIITAIVFHRMKFRK